MLAVADHRALIDRILSDNGLSPSDLELVPSVQDWCGAHGVEERNPHRMAKCFCMWDECKCFIVMASHLSAAQIRGGMNAMECYGFEDQVRGLDAPVKFLVHLVLHEVAAHVLRTTEQEPRDAWAFEQMARYAA